MRLPAVSAHGSSPLILGGMGGMGGNEKHVHVADPNELDPARAEPRRGNCELGLIA